MSQITVHIPMEDYLAQWFVHERGGTVPVSLSYGSVESKILETYLIKLPHDVEPDFGGEGKVPVYIPTFKHRPAEIYNYLPKSAVLVFTNSIRHRLDIELWNSVHPFTKMGLQRIDELIYAFMECHGIAMTEANWNALAKRFQRQRKQYNDRELQKQKYSAKKSRKSQ